VAPTPRQAKRAEQNKKWEKKQTDTSAADCGVKGLEGGEDASVREEMEYCVHDIACAMRIGAENLLPHVVYGHFSRSTKGGGICHCMCATCVHVCYLNACVLLAMSCNAQRVITAEKVGAYVTSSAISYVISVLFPPILIAQCQ